MRILIVNNNLHIGGVQKALVNLLWNIHDRYEVTLLLFSPDGAYLAELPRDVKVIQADSAYRYLGMTREDAGKKPADKFKRAFFAAMTRLFGRGSAIRLMAAGQRRLGDYDVAISYLHNGGKRAFYGGCNDFVLRHVSAGKKAAFLHCDYLRSGANTKENSAQYAQFDRIAACSEGCRRAFLSANPSLERKTMVVQNCHRYDAIRTKAVSEPVALTPGVINLVTVARLGREKGVGRAVQAIRLVKDAKTRLHYYIIGDGVERAEIQKAIAESGLSDVVTLCGASVNPYGYMKAADLLLIPSLSEAAPLVIEEAASLGTPVLSTKTASADEMITQRGLGWVCENSAAGIARQLLELLDNPALLSETRAQMQDVVFSNQTAMEQFEKAIE